MRIVFFLIALGGLFVGWAALADGLCGLRGEFVAALRHGYGEITVGHGLMADGRLVEFFLSDSGSFTIIATTPGGISCAVAAGRHWEFLPENANESPPSGDRIR